MDIKRKIESTQLNQKFVHCCIVLIEKIKIEY